ncbi:MAG: hypothetical protein QM749_10410 [Aquabacterium sp.]
MPKGPAFKLTALLLSAACCGGAMAGNGESYVGVGLPGLVVGYAYSVNQQLGLRADAGYTGRIRKEDAASGVEFEGKAKYDRVGLFGDYFPFSGGFRITGGVTINRATLELKSRFDGATSVNVNGKTVTPASSDYFNVKARYPTVMPYIGVGYGHDKASAGLGLVADLGVSIGRVKYSRDTNLVGQYGITDADIDAKLDAVDDSIGRLVVLPSASLGMSYRY